MLTIDSITETQLEGMEEDNPLLTGNNQGQNTLPADEKALLDRCSGQVMLFRLKRATEFWCSKRYL